MSDAQQGQQEIPAVSVRAGLACAAGSVTSPQQEQQQQQGTPAVAVHAGLAAGAGSATGPEDEE